jgi:hypothetical protein
MKNNSAKYFIIVTWILLACLNSCKKIVPTVPSVEFVRCYGGNTHLWVVFEVTSDGGAPVTDRGICWSNNQTPTISDIKKNFGSGTGTFSVTFDKPLDVGTYTNQQRFYYRAYATNRIGTGYSSLGP